MRPNLRAFFPENVRVRIIDDRIEDMHGNTLFLGIEYSPSIRVVCGILTFTEDTLLFTADPATEAYHVMGPDGATPVFVGDQFNIKTVIR